MNRIYVLNWDYTHSQDMERDAYHIPFPDSNKSSIIFLSDKYLNKLPKHIYFRSNLSILNDIDFPLNDLKIPVVSQKMMNILNGCGVFRSITTPVSMLDDTYLDNPFDQNGTLKITVQKNERFLVLTLPDREDCFDQIKSIYEPSELNPSIPGFINTLVLIQSVSLPPIFRIKEAPSKLFVTEKTKEALELNNVKGCVFEEVETSQGIG